ncbi:hypothetical protein [Kineococcus terrestris]|uniref:hypothetical protein n=1 Tax=Kineococcus terrestris TaxID=2044856 RepID=UPI0034DB270C
MSALTRPLAAAGDAGAERPLLARLAVVAALSGLLVAAGTAGLLVAVQAAAWQVLLLAGIAALDGALAWRWATPRS